MPVSIFAPHRVVLAFRSVRSPEFVQLSLLFQPQQGSQRHRPTASRLVRTPVALKVATLTMSSITTLVRMVCTLDKCVHIVNTKTRFQLRSL